MQTAENSRSNIHLNTASSGSAGPPCDVVYVEEAASVPRPAVKDYCKASLDDVALVMQQTGATREAAERALVACNGDLIEAILSLI